jgi:CDGSH-type Zn-finger protein
MANLVDIAEEHLSADQTIAQVVDGPLLLRGPVDTVLSDGTPVRSDRFVVAVCTCRRSKRYPLCDTSHRRRIRADRPADDKT